MRIVIMGTGGIGGYYGGLLSRQGHDVTFIARGEHLGAIQRSGLLVRSVHGDFAVSPASAAEIPADLPQPDLVLFCIKTFDTDAAVQAIHPIVGPNTTVLSLQNGVDAAERIGAVLGMQHMLAGATWISSAVEAPGVIRQVSQFRRVVIGEPGGEQSPRLEAIYQALAATGISVETSSDIRKVLWTKFIYIAAASSFGSLTRVTVGGYRGVAETRVYIVRLLQEVEAVGRRAGILLDSDIVEKTMTFYDNNAPGIKPSMQLDVEAGRRTEVDSLVGAVCRKGRELGVETPVADMLYALLLPADLQARRAQSM